MLNVLFIHNSVPEYRIEFWKELSKLINLKLVITDSKTADKIYGLKTKTDGLNILYWNKKNSKKILNNIDLYDVVILPPIDRLFEYKIAMKVKRVCLKNEVKCIYWTEKWEPSKSSQSVVKQIKNFIQKCMIKNVSRKVNRYIAAGSQSYKYLIEELGISKNKISIAYDSSTSPQSFQIKNLKEEFNLNSEGKIILFLGRLIHRKGCHVLIKACLPLLDALNLYLFICGTGSQETELKKLSKLNKRIIFVGKVQPSMRRQYFTQADVFVLPSINEKGTIEAWGLTVNEALECGTTVISTDAVGATYDLINKNNGFVVKNNDLFELRNAIKDSLKRKFSSKNIKDEYQKFNVKEMSLSFYRAIKLCREQK